MCIADKEHIGHLLNLFGLSNDDAKACERAKIALEFAPENPIELFERLLKIDHHKSDSSFSQFAKLSRRKELCHE